MKLPLYQVLSLDPPPASREHALYRLRSVSAALRALLADRSPATLDGLDHDRLRDVLQIRDHRDRQGLSITQTAQALGYIPKLVSKWSRREGATSNGRRLYAAASWTPYKSQIVRWLEAHPLSAQQIFFQRLREIGYSGGLTTVKTYVRRVRPPKQKAYLKLSFGQSGMRPSGLGRIRFDRRRLDAPATEFFS